MTGRERPFSDAEFDTLLSGWLSDGAHDAPVRIAENAIKAVATTPQEHVWMRQLFAPLTSAPVAWAAALVAIAIGLAIAFGPRLVGDDRDPVPTATPTPSASAGTPGASPSATPLPSLDPTAHLSETSLGTIAWTMVEIDQGIYPVSADDGVFTGIDHEDSTYWVSTDGIEWTPAPADPFEHAATYLGSEWAIVSPDGAGQMMGPASARQVILRLFTDNPGDAALHRLQGSEWAVVPLPVEAPPPVEGLEISSAWFSGQATLSDASWIVPLVRQFEAPWGEIYGQFEWQGEPGTLVDPGAMWDEDNGVLRIVDPGGADPLAGAPLATLTVELVGGDAPVIEFRDAETGALVHTAATNLPGWTPEDLLTRLRGWGSEDVTFVVNRGGELISVRPPWAPSEEWSEGIVAGLGRYYTTSLVLGPNYTATEMHLWESPDGIEWTEVDAPPIAEGTLDWVELAGAPDGLIMTVHGPELTAATWASSDARSWVPSDVEEHLRGTPERTDFGWIMNAFNATAVSPDGITWEAVALPELPAEPSVTYLDGTFFYGPEFVGDGYRYWIGALEP